MEENKIPEMKPQLELIKKQSSDRNIGLHVICVGLWAIPLITGSLL